jgi:hypothetical protein
MVYIMVYTIWYILHGIYQLPHGIYHPKVVHTMRQPSRCGKAIPAFVARNRAGVVDRRAGHSGVEWLKAAVARARARGHHLACRRHSQRQPERPERKDWRLGGFEKSAGALGAAGPRWDPFVNARAPLRTWSNYQKTA